MKDFQFSALDHLDNGQVFGVPLAGKVSPRPELMPGAVRDKSPAPQEAAPEGPQAASMDLSAAVACQDSIEAIHHCPSEAGSGQVR